MVEGQRGCFPSFIRTTAATPVPRAVKQLADRVLDKPFDIDDLMRAVRDVLPRRAGRAPGRSRRVGDGDESPAQDA
jgi:DNA-binding response OmpR family regulator